MILSPGVVKMKYTPYPLTAKISNLCSEISFLLGKTESFYRKPPEPKLRRGNRIKTIYASLAIEGNT